MRKGLPFVLLAIMIAALVVPVGSALSLKAASGEVHGVNGTWPVLANASGTAHTALAARSSILAPLSRPVGPAPSGSPWPEAARLLAAGLALVALSGVARLGR